jgi:hypothetical protein
MANGPATTFNAGRARRVARVVRRVEGEAHPLEKQARPPAHGTSVPRPDTRSTYEMNQSKMTC